MEEFLIFSDVVERLETSPFDAALYAGMDDPIVAESRESTLNFLATFMGAQGLQTLLQRGSPPVWNRLPQEYPDDSMVHRHFQRWVERGVFRALWAVVQEACEDLGGCDWEWQAADGAMRKARLGGRAWVPTPLIAPSPA